MKFRCSNKDQVRNSSRYLDKIKYKFFNRTKVNINIITQVEINDGLRPKQTGVNRKVDPNIVRNELK